MGAEGSEAPVAVLGTTLDRVAVAPSVAVIVVSLLEGVVPLPLPFNLEISTLTG